MPKILDDCFYDQIKILHDLSCIHWFIDKHAKEDAKKASNDKCYALLEKLEKDLEKYLIALKEMVSQ